jgi:hypothetical protein
MDGFYFSVGFTLASVIVASLSSSLELPRL